MVLQDKPYYYYYKVKKKNHTTETDQVNAYLYS